MRHLKLKGQLGVTSSHRQALLRNLLSGLLQHERIQTTIANAKQLKRFADPIIELGKNPGLNEKRLARQVVHQKDAFEKLFSVYGPRFKTRQGGYTRIFRLGHRHGDNAQMSLIEILPEPHKEKDPRIIKVKGTKAEGAEETEKETLKKKKKEAKKEDKHLKSEIKAKQEAERAQQAPDVVHSHVSRGRKTDLGTGRSKGSKKGLS
ncbi:MAG: 50S ribosomal protein L17 [Deltaproteobacteria bacterium]|nr:50S ribosomal protein L17 [Deltaproteobacteria bacterium]